MTGVRRYIGLDPGLRATGWGLIEAEDNRLRHLANGSVKTDSALDVAERLRQLHDGLAQILAEWSPDEAAVEETFVNRNARSTLKLGLARGVVLLAPALVPASVLALVLVLVPALVTQVLVWDITSSLSVHNHGRLH